MTSSQMMSSVKRDRIKKQESLKLKKDMRAALPVLTKNEIRRCRLPYHEALLLELKEEGFMSAEEFLKQLIQYQEDLRKQHGPDSAIAAMPRLIEHRKQLNKLYIGLKNAEEAHFQDNIETECDELLQMGAFFGLGPSDWWWLGEQLLIQAVNITNDFHRDGGKREATSKYIYGKFLLENMADIEKAKEHLTQSRQISVGKPWSASAELKMKQDTIFVESCKLLYKAILAEAKKMMEYDPLKAARLCTIARRRALDACDKDGEAAALMLQGLCEMAAGDSGTAVISLIKVLSLYTRSRKMEETCEARIQLALAYLKIGKFSEALNHLQQLIKYTEEMGLPYYVAQAYRFLGEYYLNQGLPHLSTSLLTKALQIFHELEDQLNREQSRNLAAISAGQELIPKYIELILKCGKPGMEGFKNVMKLVAWKDTRELFWSENDDELDTSKSLGNVESSLRNISESLAQMKSMTESTNKFGHLAEANEDSDKT